MLCFSSGFSGTTTVMPWETIKWSFSLIFYICTDDDDDNDAEPAVKDNVIRNIFAESEVVISYYFPIPLMLKKQQGWYTCVVDQILVHFCLIVFVECRLSQPFQPNFIIWFVTAHLISPSVCSRHDTIFSSLYYFSSSSVVVVSSYSSACLVIFFIILFLNLLSDAFLSFYDKLSSPFKCFIIYFFIFYFFSVTNTTIDLPIFSSTQMFHWLDTAQLFHTLYRNIFSLSLCLFVCQIFFFLFLYKPCIEFKEYSDNIPSTKFDIICLCFIEIICREKNKKVEQST